MRGYGSWSTDPMIRTFMLMAAMTAFVGVVGLMLAGEARSFHCAGDRIRHELLCLLEFRQGRSSDAWCTACGSKIGTRTVGDDR